MLELPRKCRICVNLKWKRSKLWPVRICVGALGNGLPERDLLVSRQHRMLVSSRIALRMFGQADVLIPAIRLTALPGIAIDTNVTEVEYFHILLANHEVVFAEGAATESLYTGKGSDDEWLFRLLRTRGLQIQKDGITWQTPDPR